MRLIFRYLFLLFAAGLMAFPLSAQIPPAAPDLQLRLVGANNAQTAGGKGFTIEVTDVTGAGIPDAAIVFRLPDSVPTGTFPDGTHASVSYTDRTGRANIPNIQWSSTPGVVAIRVTATKGTAHAGILVEQTLTATAASSAPALEPGVLATAEVGSPAFVVPLPQPPGPPAKLWDTQPIANPNPQAPSAPPAVTVTGGSPNISTHSAKKWIIIAAIAVGAGVGVAMAMGHSKSSSNQTASTTSIGQPSLSVGQ